MVIISRKTESFSKFRGGGVGGGGVYLLLPSSPQSVTYPYNISLPVWSTQRDTHLQECTLLCCFSPRNPGHAILLPHRSRGLNILSFILIHILLNTTPPIPSTARPVFCLHQSICLGSHTYTQKLGIKSCCSSIINKSCLKHK